MQEVPDPAQLERLERDCRALRRLARTLVRDASVAEDLVQDAWLAGIQRGQQGASFLGAALRRLALGWRRAAARRTEQEHAFVPAPSEARPDELAERLELSELVLRTLRGLPEPYRSTLTLHFLDGLSAAEIARRSGDPAGSVRARIARGLAELRLRLAARLDSGGRDWRCALLPLAGLGSAARLAWSTGTIMSIKSALACAATVALALLGWFTWHGRAEDPALPRAGAAPSQSSAAAVAADESAAASDGRARRIAEQDRALGAGRPGTRVLARAVDEDGRAVAGATLALVDGEPSAPSDAQGALQLELPLASSTGSAASAAERRFVARAAGRTELVRGLSVRAGADNWLGELILPLSGVLSGRVCDESGRGLAKAHVFATQETADEDVDPWMGPGRSLLESARADVCAADGSFSFPALPEGWWIVWACAAGRDWRASERIPVRAVAENPSVTLSLEAGDAARALGGCVLDPQGNPCEHALVELLDEHGRTFWDGQLQAPDDGRFEFRSRGARELLRIRATDAGQCFEAIVHEARSGDPQLRLQFAASPRFVLRVLDEQGAGIANAGVSGRSGASHLPLPGCGAFTDADGLATLSLPSQPYEICVVAQGFERAVNGPFDPQDGPQACEFRLLRGAGLRGRVLAAGRGIAGAELTLVELAAPGVHWAPFDEWQQPGGWIEDVQPVPEWRTRSNAEGEFVLGAPLGSRARASGRYMVLVEAPGWATAVLGPLELADHSRKDGLALELDAGGGIDGYCTSALALEYSGWRVVAANGLGCRRETPLDADGRFRLRQLAPGSWQLAPQPPWAPSEWSWYESEDSEPARTRVEVQAGRTSTARCELLGFEPVLLEGSLDVHADPPGIWTIEVERLREDGERERASARTRLRLDRTFRLRVGRQGRYRLSLECTDPRWGHAVLNDVVELGPQSVRWSGELAFARLQGHANPDTQLLYACASGPGDLRAVTCFRPGPAGAIGERWVPAGHLLIADEPHAPGQPIEHPLATLDVREHETATLAIER